MKKTFIIIYSVIMSLVLIFSITFFAVNIYNEKNHGDLRTEVRFGKVYSGVTNAIKKTSSINTETMRQIENAIGDTKEFSYIKITVDSKTIYVYPDNFDIQDSTDSSLVLPYKNSLTTSDNRKIEVSAGLYTLRPATIYYYAKISFFIILIVALLTVILIIYNIHFDKDSDKKKRRPKPVKQIVVEDDEDEEETDYEEDTEEEYEADEEIEIESEEADEIVEEPVEEKASPEPASYGHMETPQLPVKELEPVEIEEDKTDRGLFSPDTGLGWESYLMTRLDNELNRATASELDLALFLIKLGGLDRKNPVVRKICDYLIVEFQFKDLLFEYKDDSICGLKISMNIDNAITFGEKLVEDIKKLTAGEDVQILAGITTRGIRMVTGERLLKEADQAVKHAAEDKDSPVVGFRADAVKYRKFIETN